MEKYWKKKKKKIHRGGMMKQSSTSENLTPIPNTGSLFIYFSQYCGLGYRPYIELSFQELKKHFKRIKGLMALKDTIRHSISGHPAVEFNQTYEMKSKEL